MPVESTRTTDIAKGVGAVVALLALVVGVPVLLWRAGGPPIPGDAFDWDKARDAVDTGITPRAVTGILVFVCWVAWFVLAWALLSEVWNRAFGRSSRQVRGMSQLQLLAGKLVAAAFFVGTGAFAGGGAGGGGSASGAGALPPRAPAVALAADATSAVELAPAPLAAPRPLEQGWYLVRERDTLQRIAADQLGDPLRWREIWQLNQGRVQLDGRRFTKPEILRAGWQLELPADARARQAPSVAGLEPTAATAALGAERPGALPDLDAVATPYVVVKGDYLWRICERYLGREPTMDDVRAVVAANEGRVSPPIVDPDLIYPGQQLDLSVLDARR